MWRKKSPHLKSKGMHDYQINLNYVNDSLLELPDKKQKMEDKFRRNSVGVDGVTEGKREVQKDCEKN